MLFFSNNNIVSFEVDYSPKVPIWVVYTIISSILCIFGVLLVPLLDTIKKYRLKRKIYNNNDLTDLEKDNMLQFLNSDKETEASLRNVKLLNYGLSVSAGSMIMTSIYKILPKSNKVKGDIYISFGWIFGLILSFTLNYIVHHYTSESLVHCAHSHPESEESSEEDIDNQEYSHTHSHSVEPEGDHDPLPKSKSKKIHHTHEHTSSEQSSLPKSKSAMLNDLCHNVTKQNSSSKLNRAASSANITESIKCLENTIGYDLKNIDHYRSMVFNKHHLKDDDIHNDHNNNNNNNNIEEPLLQNGSASSYYGSAPLMKKKSSEIHHDIIHPNFDDNIDATATKAADHSHLLETPFSKLFSIGLQTCIALSLHKVPEGLILYFSNIHTNIDYASKHEPPTNTRGSSIFIALAIHNFIEGFAMCLPIYSAFESKVRAVVLISILGGGTQPLGAFLGYLIHKFYMDREGSNQHGLIHWISNHTEEVNISLMSVTSGFLFVIALQMLQTAIGFSDAHDHHTGKEEIASKSSNDNSGSDELGNDLHEPDHTFGTNCVRWACFGAALILASGIFSK